MISAIFLPSSLDFISLYNDASNDWIWSISTSSKYPLVKQYKITASSSTFKIWCKSCFNTSIVRLPLSKRDLVEASRSEPNCVNASNSRNEAKSRRNVPDTFLIALVWAAPPTRDTDKPALIAGLIPL